MKTFHTKSNSQVKLFNNKIIPNLAEYYFLEDLKELGKIKSFNINKYIFIKVENKLDPKNIKSMKFALLIDNFRKMNESSLLKKIAKSKYVYQILTNINIDFTQKKKYYYLVENPILYPEEQCNAKFNIVDDKYLFNFMERHNKNLEMVKNSNGILPNMKIKESE